MHLHFDDNGLHRQLAPLTLTRPVAEIRFGILTLAESWQRFLVSESSSVVVSYKTEDYLSGKYPTAPISNESIQLMGNVKPTPPIAEAVLKLEPNSVLYVNDVKVAQKGLNAEKRVNLKVDSLCKIEAAWHIFQKNDEAIAIDYGLITRGREKENIGYDPEMVKVSKIGSNQIFIEKGARLEHVVLNASAGPIYIGKNAEIMEGALIRGPFALCEGAGIKMGAKIYGATTVGPHCKIGGEVSNCVFQAYSNKGHDGFLGNSVVGEWCNFGADTNSSNLKNNYSTVKIHDYRTGKLENTAVLFCGVLMGDHSKTGINTMLNTATVVGVSANIFGGDFPPKYIPSFAWGGKDSTTKFILEKAFEVAENMMARRNLKLSDSDKGILTYLHANLA